MENKDNQKLHIAMFPWLAYGHIMPFLEVSKFLAQKGHRVSFISTPKNIQRLLKSSLSPLITFVELPLPAIEGLPQSTESTSELPIHKVPYLKKAYDLLQPPVKHFLQHSDVNWVIHDVICHWLPRVATQLGINSVYFNISNATSLAFFGPPSELRGGQRQRPEEFTVVPKWVDFPSNVAFKLHEMVSHWDCMDDEVSDFQRLADAIQHCNLVTMRSSTEFESDSVSLLRKLYGKPVVPLGLLPPSSVPRQHGGADDQVDEKCEVLNEWLNNKKEKSVIYIALGTEVTLSQELMHELSHGIEKSGLPFIWVVNNRPLVEGMLGADIIPPGLKPGWIIAVWCGGVAPQLKILGHSSIGGFLTHCGWSSVIEALGFGRVLILFSGANSDQGLIARLLHWKQVGLEIPRDERDGSFSSDSVAELTRRVMVDKEGADPRWDKRGPTTPWMAGKLAKESMEAPLDCCWKPPWVHTNCSMKVPSELCLPLLLRNACNAQRTIFFFHNQSCQTTSFWVRVKKKKKKNRLTHPICTASLQTLLSQFLSSKSKFQTPQVSNPNLPSQPPPLTLRRRCRRSPPSAAIFLNYKQKNFGTFTLSPLGRLILDPPLDLTTLKLICNLRGVRGTGKSDKEGFYTAAFWLHKHHPKTLACNVASLAEFGYFKDLPEILYRLQQGEDVRKTQKAEWSMRKGGACRIGRRGRSGRRGLNHLRPPYRGGVTPCGGGVSPSPPYYGGGFAQPALYGGGVSPSPSYYGGGFAPPAPYGGGPSGLRPPFGGGLRSSSSAVKGRGSRNRKGDVHSREARVKREMERAQLEKEKASSLRREKKISMAQKALGRYQRDPDFRFLYERVSDLFAECLKSDIENFNSNQYKKITLAAKWCPSIDSSFDRAILLCESIARKVFPRESYPEYEGVEDTHYAYRVRDRLRKDVLVPLRKVLELPEVYIGVNRWGSIPYNRVASVAMKFYKEKFLKHDEERFKKYLEDVKAGKSTIAAGALLPHEIIESLNHGDGGQVAELQWKRMVDDMLKQGKMNNCLAVCDVSGSMNGTLMEVSVALGLLVSELSEEPWKGKVITFSARPKLHLIQDGDLMSKCEFVRTMEWGGNTNFQKVFDLLLQVAVKGRLKPEHMIKRIFVFSDMEFDQASANRWETDYQTIQRNYNEKGYGNAIPQIVFWNLRHSLSTPVPSTQPGVALLSGYSKNLMKLFLDNDGEVRPDSVMDQALSGEEYQKLLVLD